MTCPKTVPYPSCGGSCIAFRSRWGSQRQPNNHRNKQPNPTCPPSLSLLQPMQGSPLYNHPLALVLHCKRRICAESSSQVPVCFCSAGWCKRQSWLACLRRSCMSLSFTGLLWKTLLTRLRWWLTCSWRAVWRTHTCTCQLQRIVNSRRWDLKLGWSLQWFFFTFKPQHILISSSTFRVTPAGWRHAEWSRETRVYGGSERTERLNRAVPAIRGWFTLLMTITRIHCRCLKRLVGE